MAGYVKIWTEILSDEWFVGLTPTARNCWFTFLVAAKTHGDCGTFSVSSWRAVGTLCGVDGKSARKILSEFRTARKILYEEKDTGVITIKIPKYKHYQRDRNPKEQPEMIDFSAESATPIPQLSRADNSTPKQTKTITSPDGEHAQVIRFWMDSYKNQIGVDYGFNGKQDGAAVQWLLKTFGLESAKAMVLCFVNDPDPWLEGKKTLGMLRNQANKVVQKLVAASRGTLGMSGEERRSNAELEKWLRSKRSKEVQIG